MSQRRYALAGASQRALHMYARPVAQKFAQSAVLVGVFDVNLTRSKYLSRQCGDVPVFTDFDALLREARPESVIVTTVDRFHHEYILRALEAGCDVITEKPMTIDAEKCRAILAAEARTGRHVTVVFNYRFIRYITRVKELLRDNVIGPIFGVEFAWLLDRHHGADYFRRWHRRKENSGGLLVHKATHHFDLVNWWLEDEPESVWAQGARRFYGATRAERGERCSTCSYANTCEFYVNMAADPSMRALYFEAEHEDGYHRDGCVFADEIDIEDTLSVLVRYRGGALLNYSLCAYSPYEGWRMTLNGRDGRIELESFESGPRASEPSEPIRVFDKHGGLVVSDIPKATGGHGGGDELLLARLFGPTSLLDPLGHMAGSRAGALSMLIGAGANESMATGQAVIIADLLRSPRPETWFA